MATPKFVSPEDKNAANFSKSVVLGIDITAAAEAFAVKNRSWITMAAKSGILKQWQNRDFQILETMAGPDGIEKYAELLDLALSGLPSASNSTTQTSSKWAAYLARSTLFDNRIGGLIQVMPDALATVSSQHLEQIARFDVTPEVQKETEREITRKIHAGLGVEQLSSLACQYLNWLLLVLAILMNFLALQNGARSELCFFVPKVFPTMTSGSYGKVVRAVMCDAAVPSQEFVRFRIVKGDRVRLRTEPRMSSALVALAIQNLDLLEVIDDTNRDWLYVSVVNEKEVEGWISRKYTHRLSR
ncbi:SH3 domain-containing protein [Pseudomonas sp. MF6768]|uniref:SH3 domain-containing protein n=1 Tax=Pseudomonas sp. MF6768 TaxID=2797532 RepID=UPI0018E6F362|nr:SH3 domain-containing protein [Pseudomonas sp. MF6768]MBJ2241713.1 hypothetical protein [Pseudomonas sp. MF6768]